MPTMTGSSNDRRHAKSLQGLERLNLEAGLPNVRRRYHASPNTGMAAPFEPAWPWSSCGTRTEGRAYFDAKKAAGKTSMEATRALKRRLSNVVYARMIADQKRRQAADPGGHSGTTLISSVTDLTPNVGPSDKPLPGPATNHPRPLVPAVP